MEEVEALKLQARLEDLTDWQRELVKLGKKGSKTYSCWIASWREGGRTRNVLPEGLQENGWRGGQGEGQGEEGGDSGLPWSETNIFIAST